MKSVPIIFLIFMFIILTIPAYAADTKKITSVNIQRIYKAKEGEINPDQVSFKPGRSEYTITYQGMYDASDLPIGSYMDYKITLNAKKSKIVFQIPGQYRDSLYLKITHPAVLPFMPIRFQWF